ncbi:hypothetical protein HPP92_023442 [Vanilla planifolia]|uniref:YDG domain-containing protein n=1 Tax=Vanilla planifolia TaxID=51239 RepID=A0A835PQD0_VANPL|nr:hypothetical protein HPP92_023442 [Vanilla planifolia]
MRSSSSSLSCGERSGSISLLSSTAKHIGSPTPSSTHKRPKLTAAAEAVPAALRVFRALCRELSVRAEPCLAKLGPIRRVDLKAVEILKANGRWPLNGIAPILGPVPGVEVGAEFIYRMELALVRLHRPPEHGIDYDPVSGFATSIVASGGYPDLWNFSKGVLSYIGMGGCPGRRNGEARDQKMEGGNLALKRSIEEKMPVRVIYGFRNLKQRTASVFVYDGLYTVDACRKVIGSNDCFVFEFQLRRMEGQQPSSSKRELEMMKMFRKWQQRSARCASKKLSKGKLSIETEAVMKLLS